MGLKGGEEENREHGSVEWERAREEEAEEREERKEQNGMGEEREEEEGERERERTGRERDGEKEREGDIEPERNRERSFCLKNPGLSTQRQLHSSLLIFSGTLLGRLEDPHSTAGLRPCA